MNKVNSNFTTTAVKRAARGILRRQVEPSNRASTIYGFSNHALKKSGEELKAAWRSASQSVRHPKG
ncbi:hypothetical protein LGZ99_04740 [Photorhabdus temperata]|uniref:Uncharacterized protein n=1 Tax=Photorhabdus temperata subsp. temperata Meg1 TaxID=1393735 RepID=A0A081S1L0_PHOTE|nr:hypothetical protein [Photorhabdus temperata]KER04813.1 hypothetical protein MEG1DRAFT_00599 [Photorhabdus temperata subsp. temperata Meg1]MCT8346538.1 hypothetical protein [Photorhabdus temperata]